MKKVIALAAVLSLSVSALALAQTMDNSTNGSTNAASGNNAMGSTMGNAPSTNTGSTMGGSATGTGSMGSMGTTGSMGAGSMGSGSTMGSTAATTPSTGAGMNNGMANNGTTTTGTMAGTSAQTTNTQATVVPQPGSGATVPTMSGKAAGNQPLKGSNSFTEKQAERRLTKQGYSNIAGLAKDNSGVWRGTATNKSSKSVSVALDYKGRITETQ